MRLTNIFYAALQTTAGILSSNKEADQRRQPHTNIALTPRHLPENSVLVFDTDRRANSKFSKEPVSLSFQPPHLENLDQAHIARRRSASFTPKNVDLLDENLIQTEIFRLFNLSHSQAAQGNASENAISVSQTVRNYIENKEVGSSHPFTRHLLIKDYLRKPLQLDFTYRIKNYSPGEPPPSGAIDCDTPQPITHSPKQLGIGSTMTKAVRLATQAISMHTPFSLREAQPGEQEDIHLQTNLCPMTRHFLFGGTSPVSHTFYTTLRQPKLKVIDKTFTEENAKNVVDAFRQQYGGKNTINFIWRDDVSPIVTPGSAPYYLATHELGHALNLDDISMTYGLEEDEELAQYFLPRYQAVFENSIMAYNGIPMNTTSACSEITKFYPQSFMPYDYLAINELAKLVLKEQHADHSEEALQAIIAKKSPHRGNTHYRFNPQVNSFDIIDHRDGGVRASYTMHPSPKGYVQLTLVDPAGHDTLDFRAFHTPVYIDMRPGGVLRYNTSALAANVARCNDTSTGDEYDLNYKAKGNVYLTLETHANTLLEDTLTGSGNDVVHGNALDNAFHLGKGHDVVHGDQGCDSFIFQRGDNQLTINDFNATCDRLVLHPNLGVSSHRQLMTHTYKGKHDNSLNIHFRHGDRITLNHFGDKTKIKPENILIQAYAENKIRRALV